MSKEFYIEYMEPVLGGFSYRKQYFDTADECAAFIKRNEHIYSYAVYNRYGFLTSSRTSTRETLADDIVAAYEKQFYSIEEPEEVVKQIRTMIDREV